MKSDKVGAFYSAFIITVAIAMAALFQSCRQGTLSLEDASHPLLVRTMDGKILNMKPGLYELKFYPAKEKMKFIPLIERESVHNGQVLMNPGTYRDYKNMIDLPLPKGILKSLNKRNFYFEFEPSEINQPFAFVGNAYTSDWYLADGDFGDTYQKDFVYELKFIDPISKKPVATFQSNHSRQISILIDADVQSGLQ